METSKKRQATSDYQKQLEKAIEMSKNEYKVIFCYITYETLILKTVTSMLSLSLKKITLVF